MEYRILHLYHDLMNLYGESGNVRALSRHLSDQGFTVSVDKKSVGEDVDFSRYDFVYIGCGTERNQKVALHDLLRYRDVIAERANEDAVFFLTGNAFEMLGKSITAADGTVYPGLELAQFEVTELSDKRYTGDAVCNSEWYAKPMVGFINKCSHITGVEHPLFEMKLGEGNAPGDKKEGYRFRNVFGTHLIGPVLVKNPHFMTYMIKLIGSQTADDFQMKTVNYDYETKAYQVTLAELMQRVESVN
ncbi:MAG: glutamine amidotransferase [Clostridiales bacterium]|jgi:CobQ-like glutamine amidotransferase family enzyme|nr:glutamine amidotransferase [Clostridiales bacterium]